MKLNHTNYFHFHDIFRKYTNQSELIIDWFNSNVINNYSQEKCNLLSIGAGDGSIDLEIVRKLNEITYMSELSMFIEPNLKSLNKLKSQRKANEKYTYIQDKIENITIKEDYNIILSIHSIYHVNNYMNMIKKCMEHLTVDGKLYIVISSNINLINIKNQIYSLLNIKRTKEYFDKNTAKDIFEQNKYNYSEYILKSYIDFSQIKENLNDIKILLSFLININLSTIDNKLFLNIINILKPYLDSNLKLQNNLVFFEVYNTIESIEDIK